MDGRKLLRHAAVFDGVGLFPANSGAVSARQQNAGFAAENRALLFLDAPECGGLPSDFHAAVVLSEVGISPESVALEPSVRFRRQLLSARSVQRSVHAANAMPAAILLSDVSAAELSDLPKLSIV